MAHQPTPRHHHHRVTNSARHLRTHLQPPPPTPSPATSRHPGHRLHQPTQSQPSKPHRHPQPSPPRPHRPSRRHHPARRWTPTPHRRRPNLHRHPRARADPRPPHPHHPRHHRRTPPRANPEPPQGLPTHRRTKRPHTEKVPNLTQVRNYSDVLRHHTAPPAGLEPATEGLPSADSRRCPSMLVPACVTTVLARNRHRWEPASYCRILIIGDE
jgi:hypothetical protein